MTVDDDNKTPTDSHEKFKYREVHFCLNIYYFKKCHHVVGWEDAVLESNNTE
jgi:hypothetical protein